MRLIQKWLNAGILEAGKVIFNENGITQGSSASPLLANVFLHYVYDLWVQQWRTTQAQGNVIVVRYGNDSVVGFQYESDARQFQKDLVVRLQKFGLELHPDKTQLIKFGKFAAESCKRRKEGKPETFKFFGFVHICGKTRKGKFAIKRISIKKRLREKVKEIKEELRVGMHDEVHEVGKWLRSVIIGYNQYFGIHGNCQAMGFLRHQITLLWRHVLGRRSQKGYVTWERMNELCKRWLPRPQIYHKYPSERFGVTI